jgi:hypothetical protein
VRPYLYILGVLLVGGGIGYFIGQKSARFEHSLYDSSNVTQNDEQLILQILNRQSEAYRVHDALLVFRDCASSYVEVDGSTGEGRGLEKSVIACHELFRPGQSINFNVKEPDIKIVKNSAVVRASYSKTSDLFEKEGISGLLGQGLWLLSKSNGTWQIHAFWWTEESKKK